MIISRKAWNAYLARLRLLSETAANEMRPLLERTDLNDADQVKALIDIAYGIATKYGEGATALVCEMYDALAAVAGVVVPAAEPAATATYGEVAKAVYGTRMLDNEVTAGAIGRVVKLAGVDTMMQNALRDGAEWAWIPSGDTCAFCITLASNGWQRATKAAIKNGHAEHVHANCDCTYAVRFNSSLNIEGYEPKEYQRMYDSADGNTPKQRINSMRREFYAENKEIINERRREAYARNNNDEKDVG